MSEIFEQCRALMETMMSGAGSWVGGMMPMGGGMVLIGLVWLILLTASGIAIASIIVRGRGRHNTNDARQVLDVRYARGELDGEAYIRMRADLTDDAPAAR